MCTVGLVIPVYNSEKYIDKCISSVLNQIERFDEIIIVLDGSTDKSESIILERTSGINEAKIIHQDNKGAGVARNSGIKASTADIICFLDSDDVISDDMAKHIKMEFSKEQVDVLYFDANIIDEIDGSRKNIYHRVDSSPKVAMAGIEYFSLCYPCDYVVQPCMAAYRRQYIVDNNILFPENRICEDNYFSFAAMCNASLVKYIPEKLYTRRYREGSLMTSELTDEKWADLCDCFTKCWDYAHSLDLVLFINHFDRLLSFYLNTFFYIHFIYNSSKPKLSGNINNVELYYEMQEKLARLICDKRVIEGEYDWAAADIVRLFLCMSDIEKTMFGVLSENNWKIIRTAVEKYRQQLRDYFEHERLTNIDETIAIYGKGDYTRRFVLWYQWAMGNAIDDYFIIDSYSKTKSVYWHGNCVINVNDVSDFEIDCIIIPSPNYSEDMELALKKNGFTGRIVKVRRDALALIEDLSLYMFMNKISSS